MASIKEIFIHCQDHLQTHPKLLKAMTKIYHSIPLDDFIQEFNGYLKYSLIIAENHPAVERTLTFVAKFAVSLETSTSTAQKAPDNSEEIANSIEDENSIDDVEPMNPFLLNLFDFLFGINTATSQAVRYRVCYMINKLLNRLGSGSSITEDLYDRISQTMMERLRDKHPLVRTQAVFALSWLQDPTNHNCPVIGAYLFHLSRDPHPNVRRAILSVIAICAKTLCPVMERTRDVKDTVRRAAFLYLSEKVPVRSLTISQRVKLLQQGLSDRSDAVRKTVEQKLLPAWLKFYQNSVIDFLHSLDIQDSSEIAKLALTVLFKSWKPTEIIKNFNLLNDNHLIPLENLTCESAFYWRCLCQYVKTLGGGVADEVFDTLVSDLTPFCEYLKGYILKVDDSWKVEKKLEHEFVSQQLLILAGEFDLADQAGRNSLHFLVRDLLLSMDVNVILVKPLITCYGKVKPNPETSLTELVEIISDIREPITVVEKQVTSEVVCQIELQVAKMRVELNVLREKLENCIETQEFTKAQEIKEKISSLEIERDQLQQDMLPSSQEIRTEKNDPQTLLKCLIIASEMFEQIPIKELHPAIQSLMETLLLPGIQNEDPAVRNQAVMSLGLCCLLNVDVASQHLLLFIQISQVDQELIQVTALKAIFDLLLYFGLEAFQCDDIENDLLPDTVSETDDSIPPTQDSQQALSNVMSILSSQLDSKMQEVRAVAAEGIGKLLLLGRIYSPRLLSRLLLLWYSPITESDIYLRHFLGVFLPVFASSGRSSQECLEEAFLLTLQTLFNAPSSSPLAEIDEWNVARFLVQLTSPYICNQKNKLQESSIHDRLAVQICNKIFEEPASFQVRILSKTLCQLEITSHCSLKDLAVLAEQIVEKVKDRTSVKLLQKFLTTVNQLLKKYSNKTGSSLITSTAEQSMDAIEPVEILREDVHKSQEEPVAQHEELEIDDSSPSVANSETLVSEEIIEYSDGKQSQGSESNHYSPPSLRSTRAPRVPFTSPVQRKRKAIFLKRRKSCK